MCRPELSLFTKKVSQESTKSLGQQLNGYLASGVWPFLLVVSLTFLILSLYEYLVPKKDIDIVKDYTHKSQKKLKER
ncbi:hypothetical protein NQ315_008014 [Exocentrus adspersus]|uniref:Uncharacterized protein n=1 Tax=Exocentrus adspersus TaxID=1586481 RepID=A0AAV8VWP0_9CUCU|nr:hypothetical protein NQ315_008014 [Exocentrus adspersus]